MPNRLSIFCTLLCCVLLFLLSTTATIAQAADDAPDRLTLAAYNVENMFDVFDDPYSSDEIMRVKPRAQIETIAQAIRTLNADVVAFSEIENEGMLRAMVHDFLPDMGYDYIAAGPTNTGHGINLGLISRLPIDSITSHRFQTLTLPGEQQSWRFARDLMKARLKVSDERMLDLYVVHFKSKRDSDGDPESVKWRLAEARAVGRLIAETLDHDPDAWVALTGDLNDLPDSPTLATFLEEDHRPALLTDIHADLPPEERITYLKKPYRSTIDYILVSPALAERYVPGSATVLADQDLLTGSDHAPLAASFRVEEEDSRR